MHRSIRLGLRLESKICLSLRRLTLDIPNDILDLNIMLGQTHSIISNLQRTVPFQYSGRKWVNKKHI